MHYIDNMSSRSESSSSLDTIDLRIDVMQPPHLIPFAALEPFEIRDALSGTPDTIREALVSDLRLYFRSVREAWIWFVHRNEELTEYFEAMFYVINRASTNSSEYQIDLEDVDYIQWQLSEWKIRFECTSEALAWEFFGLHLPCWEVVLAQATSSGRIRE